MWFRIALSLLGILFITPHTVLADHKTHHWSDSFGDAVDQTVTSVAIDNEGHVIVIGHFDGAVDFGGGDLVAGGASSCTFLAKFDGSGAHMWSRNLGDSLKLCTNKMAVDGNSNILIVNDFNGTVDFGGGVISSQGFRDGVIAKIDAAGDHVWSRRFGGPSASVEVKAAGVDGAGNLIVAGLFTGTIDFGGASLTATWFTTNMFVVKFHPTGAHLWSQKYTGGLIEIAAVAGDPAGNVYITGYHSGSFDLGGGTITADFYNIFLVKYDSGGAHAWSHTYGDAGTYQHAYDVAADLSGNVFITGDYLAPLDLGGGYLTHAGNADAYLAKFDTNGNHAWSQPFGDGHNERAYSVATDASGNVAIGGHFFDTIDFGHDVLAANPIDFWAARFDGDGNHLWSQRFDVANLGLPNDQEYSISVAMNVYGDMAFAGSFKDTVDCGGGARLGSGGWDIFAVKFGTPPTAVRSAIAAEPEFNVYPNPFNPRTSIVYSTLEPGLVNARVYDVTGRHIKTLASGIQEARRHVAVWNGRDDNGRDVASGIYFVRLETRRRTATKKVVLLK
jgi:hypothetical protein